MKKTECPLCGEVVKTGIDHDCTAESDDTTTEGTLKALGILLDADRHHNRAESPTHEIPEMLSREVLDRLNEILKCDYGALSALVRERVICGEGLENHPHVVCEDGRVGMLGILNGVLAPIIGHRIAAVFDDVTDVLTGFVRYNAEL